MKTCENCGCAVYSLGCVNCDEENYIAEQEALTDREPEYASDKIRKFEDIVPARVMVDPKDLWSFVDNDPPQEITFSEKQDPLKW